MRHYGNRVETKLTATQKKSITKQKAQLTEQERHDRLQDIVDDYYSNAILKVKPVFPYILVRVLPKWMKQGLLYIPDNTKKVLHEGVVLDTYNPFWKHRKTSTIADGQVISNTDEVWVEPSVMVGDHILFQHFEGIPVEHKILGTAYVKAQTYVMIASDPIGNGRNGVIGVIEKSVDIVKLVTEFLEEHSDLADAWTSKEIAEKITKKFIMSPADQESVTHSLISVK